MTLDAVTGAVHEIFKLAPGKRAVVLRRFKDIPGSGGAPREGVGQWAAGKTPLDQEHGRTWRKGSLQRREERAWVAHVHKDVAQPCAFEASQVGFPARAIEVALEDPVLAVVSVALERCDDRRVVVQTDRPRSKVGQVARRTTSRLEDAQPFKGEARERRRQATRQAHASLGSGVSAWSGSAGGAGSESASRIGITRNSAPE